MNIRTTLLLLLSLTFVLAGCGTTGSPEAASSGEDKVTLTMWKWSGSISDQVLDKVKDQFPNVDLKVEELPAGDDFKTRLQTTLAGGGAGPDIVTMDSWVTEFVPYHDKFLNLYDYGARDVQDKYLDWKWKQAATPDDSALIALPIDVGPYALYYRGDVFREAGLPSDPAEVSEQFETWEDFLDAAVTLNEKTGTYIKSITDNFKAAMGQSENYYFDENEQFIGDQAHVKAAWDIAVKTKQLGVAYPDPKETEFALNNSEMVALIHASWYKSSLEEYAPNTSGKWRVALPPGGAGNWGGSFAGIMAGTDHPEEAYEVLEWIVNPDNSLTTFQDLGNFPSMPEVYERDEMRQEDPFFGDQKIGEVFAASAEAVKPAHRSGKDSMVESAFTEQLGLVMNQDKDPDQAWEDALAKIRTGLAR